MDSERWVRMEAGQTVASKEEGGGRSGDGRCIFEMYFGGRDTEILTRNEPRAYSPLPSVLKFILQSSAAETVEASFIIENDLHIHSQRWVTLLIEQASMELQAALTENKAALVCLFTKKQV